MGTKPLSPKDVISAKKDTLPDELLEAVNELIAEKWDGHQAVIRQEEIVSLTVGKIADRPENKRKGFSKFKQEWLNFEEIYRKEGWIVDYDKPGYNESYPASFTFKKRRMRG